VEPKKQILNPKKILNPKQILNPKATTLSCFFRLTEVIYAKKYATPKSGPPQKYPKAQSLVIMGRLNCLWTEC
jgi:hypothetical protein